MMRIFALIALLIVPAAARAAEPKPFVRGSFAAILEARQAQPVVVAFWSVHCAPCLAELPVWRALLKTHPGLKVVLVSTDSLDEAPAIARHLGRNGLEGVDSWAFAERFVERLRHDVDPDWQGELPRTYLADRVGARAVTGIIDEAAVERWLAESGR